MRGTCSCGLPPACGGELQALSGSLWVKGVEGRRNKFRYKRRERRRRTGDTMKVIEEEEDLIACLTLSDPA